MVYDNLLACIRERYPESVNDAGVVFIIKSSIKTAYQAIEAIEKKHQDGELGADKDAHTNMHFTVATLENLIE